jgi:APA family basic amino acid/polyamine antiporter
MLPAFLAKLHPEYKTPVNAILMISILSSIAPFFGRPALVWLVDAGRLGIVIAYFFVALSFLVLRQKEPNMERSFKVPAGMLVGCIALIGSVAMIGLYMLSSPFALLPVEWLVFDTWMLLGLGMYAWSRKRYGVAHSDAVMRQKLKE